MADFKTLDFEAERRVVVVCSSTGNGDAPDNADRFYRYVKRKTTPAILAKSHFAVCAMGDQNYELFCEVGKQFDAVRINCEAGNYDTFPSAIHPCCPSRLEHDFEKFVNLGDDRNIASVYVQGKRRR